jgi:hypothetical protein
MPFCPSCRAEYRPGIETCADCNLELVEMLPARYAPPPPTGNDVPVARADSLAIVEMWAELLGEEGIACRMVPAGVGDTVLVPGQAQWELRVAAIDASRALELLPGDEPMQTDEPADTELAAELADAAGESRALRWFIVAGLVFVAIMAIAVLARLRS